MPIIDLALKDLRQLARDRSTFIMLLILPVVFTLLFGFAFGGAGDPRLPVGVVNQDNGSLSQRLVELLDQSTVVRLELLAAGADLQEQVEEEDVAAGLVIPEGYSSGLAAGSPLEPLLIVNPAGNASFAVQGEVETILFRLASAVQAAQLTVETAESQGEEGVTFDDSLAEALAAWEEPPITMSVFDSGALLEKSQESNTNYSPYANTSPGMMAQFAIAGLMGAAGIFVAEKQNRSLQRMLSVNVSRMQILIGHFLAMFLMIVLQLVVLVLFGQIVLDLPYLSQPLATMLVTVMSATFCASLGLLIGVLAKSEEQATVFALVPMFLLAGFGGAWVPLEVTPEAFQRIASLTPLAWIMEGYKDIIVRGQGLAEVTLPGAVLAGYSLVLFAIARWRFRVS
jgi:ABC-2 type transport system permease protein